MDNLNDDLLQGLILWTFINVAEKPCPANNPSYTQIGNQCYYFDANKRTKEEAKSYCKNNHGKLWEPKTIKRINEVHASWNSISHLWVGISDVDSEGTFKYETNGETFPFLDKNTPWQDIDPNGGSAENCVMMTNYSPLEFQDVGCDFVGTGGGFYSICESDSIPQGTIFFPKISSSQQQKPLFCFKPQNRYWI